MLGLLRYIGCNDLGSSDSPRPSLRLEMAPRDQSRVEEVYPSTTTARSPRASASRPPRDRTPSPQMRVGSRTDAANPSISHTLSSSSLSQAAPAPLPLKRVGRHLFPARVDQRPDRQPDAPVGVGLHLQRAHAHQGQLQRQGQPLGGAHPHPDGAEPAGPQGDPHAGQVPRLPIHHLQKSPDGRHQLPCVVSGGTPGHGRNGLIPAPQGGAGVPRGGVHHQQQATGAVGLHVSCLVQRSRFFHAALSPSADCTVIRRSLSWEP